ncbi:MAG: nucleotidyltransferase family protein [Clostridia bacterium]|nr:nucleotidyltransferase family protein [Clostridia bacterium]
MNIACVLLAAGLGTRAGGDKLSRLWHGAPLIAAAAELAAAGPFGKRVAVVREHDAVVRTAVKNAGLFETVNPAPGEGITSSLKLGLAAVTEGETPDGVLFLVADQPQLKPETIAAMCAAFETAPGCILRPQSPEGKTGNPVLFPKDFFGELAELTGDMGGKQVVHRHPECVRFVPCGAEELADLDTALDFGRADGV